MAEVLKFTASKKSTSTGIPLDEIFYEILEDGTIKTTTPRISTPNHANADALLDETDRLMGGSVKIEARKTEKALASKQAVHVHE